LQLNNYFVKKDDLALIGSLLQLNGDRDFVIFDIYGKILGITEKIFANIRDKLALMGTISNLKLEDFFKKFNIILIFPEIVEIIRKFSKKILDCEKANH
jgi:hypothetical protein